MPNYSIIINSKFRPFSYDEMIKPVQAMYEQHSKIEEGLSELETKANIWEGLANEQTDEKAYKQYKKYADDLRAAADDLALNGLNASSRQNLYRMKSRYASEITPIENAYQLRAADIKAQSDLAARTGGRTVFTKSARTMSLDDYLNGMPLDYSSVNLNDVYTTTAAGTQAITKRYFNTEEGKRFQNEYYSLMQTQGISPTDTKGQNNIIQALRHSGKYPELDKFYTDTLASFGLSNFSPADQARIMQTADAGMNAGIFYDQKEQLQQNLGLAYQRDLNKIAYQHSLSNPAPSTTQGMPGYTVPIHFAEGTSNLLKDKMAKATLNTLKAAAKTGNTEAKKYMAKFKNNDEAILKDLRENGWTLGRNNKEQSTLYYAIGNSIRGVDNKIPSITKDEKLINIWRSPQPEGALTKEQREAVEKGQRWAQHQSLPTIRDKWTGFDDRARQAYVVNAIGMRDDTDALKDYLKQQVFPALRTTQGNAVKMYNIKSMDSAGNINYSTVPTKNSELPHEDRDPKKPIDYGRIQRVQLHNGDWMYVWENDKGEIVQKAVKRTDLGPEAVANWNGVNSTVRGAANLLARHEISKEEFDMLNSAAGDQGIRLNILETAETEVPNRKID